MFPTQMPGINSDGFSRCEEQWQAKDTGISLSPVQKMDAALKESIYHVLWRDDVLRAIEYGEIDIQVKNGTVYLSGHIVSASSQSRIKNAVRTVPGIGAIKNSLVLDDKLTLDVAAALGTLEHTHDCKFFTGASHGVVSLNGTVSDQNVKSLAEKCAASNSKVRGVINNVHILGIEPETRDQPFLQPIIGEIIYFSDGIYGIVKQVVINPNNRCVIAMILHGDFSKSRNTLPSLSDEKALPLEQLIVAPMRTVRYLTKSSGFLHIKSNEIDQYQDFDPVFFYTPNWDWIPPHPYCPGDVLFPAKYRTTDIQPVQEPLTLQIATDLEGAKLKRTAPRQ